MTDISAALEIIEPPVFATEIIVSGGDQNFDLPLKQPIKADSISINLGARGLTGSAPEPYIHVQSEPASIWTVVHSKGHLADITIYDDENDVIIGDIHHDTNDIATITFSIPVSGIARVD